MDTKLENLQEPMQAQSSDRLMPADLSQAIGSQGLLKLTLDAVQHLHPLPRPSTPRAQGGFRSEMLLTLLTYSYCVGLYSSRDIESAIRQDRVIRYICAGSRPDWQTLRRFRRQHRSLLETAMLHVLKQVWAFRFDSGEADYAGYDWFESELVAKLTETATIRLDVAALLDGSDAE
jgi:hypothetical protein